MTTAWIPLATTTLSSAANSVTFSNIPSQYRDLIVVAQRKTTSGTNSEKFYLNGDTTNSNYTRVGMYGDGSNDFSYSGTNSSVATINTTTSSIVYQLMDYSATDKQKSFLYRDNNTANIVLAGMHRWASTAAVTSIEVEVENNNYAIGSTFSLWGSNRL